MFLWLFFEKFSFYYKRVQNRVFDLVYPQEQCIYLIYPQILFNSAIYLSLFAKFGKEYAAKITNQEAA